MRINYQARESEAILADRVIRPVSPFVTREGGQYIGINISRDGENKEMALCHEIAHVLLCKHSMGYESDLDIAKEEVMAWRLAKSFCKARYWSDSKAVWHIESYIDGAENFVILWRLWGSLKNRARVFGLRSNRITPINQGIRI